MNVRERLLAAAKSFREEYDSGGHIDDDGAERMARCLEDAAARIAELEGLSEWLPIATAPKDGDSVLTWDGERVDMAHWSTFGDGPGCWVVDNTDVGIKPTHWMPRPEPPVQATP